MHISFLVRKWHRWLGLFIGLQAVLWLVSGVYMVTVDLDYIHGDHLVRNMDESLPPGTSGLLPLSQIQARFPEARQIRLVAWLGEPFYRVYGADEASLVDARTGAVRSPLTEEDVRRVAEYHFAPAGKIQSVRYLGVGDDAPLEIQSRPLPLWQVQFDDSIGSRFYISPWDGRVVTRRHTFWRGFDFMWMLHIMDYDDRSDMNNNLLRAAAVAGSLLAVVGLWLLFFSFGTRRADAPGRGDAA